MRAATGHVLIVAVAFMTGGAAAHRPAVSTAAEALRGDAAWAELDRRGDKAPLLAALEAARYEARPLDDVAPAVVVNNPAHSLRAIFAPDAVRLHTGATVTSLRPVGLGYRDTLLPLTHVSTLAVGPRVDIERTSNVTEWWINRASGLEHGYTVREAPAGRRDHAWLRVAFEVDGDLVPRVAADGQSAVFVTGDGETQLLYDHLVVTDATGRSLPARLRADDVVISIEADDTGARYPITIDPTFTAPVYLKASNTGANDGFGASVAVSGNTVVVGAHAEDGSGTGVNPASDDNASSAGAAYVFVRSGTTWSQQAYLKASNTEAQDFFGWAVAISGDTIVIGAYQEDGSGTEVNPASNENAADAGAAYVFVRTGTTWSQQAYLKASNTGPGDRFGYAVSVSGDTIVVGAYTEDGNGTGVDPVSNDSAEDAGAAFVFVRDGTTWSQQAYLKASNTGPVDWFGSAVAVSGDTIVVGAYFEDGSGTGVNPASNENASQAGAAYVFARNGTTWSEQAYLKASNADVSDFFGRSVAASADTVVVGADFEDGSGSGVNPPSNENATWAGAAYVFVRNGVTWSQQAYLKASNTDGGDSFGRSVGVSGDTIVVGAFQEDGGGIGVNPVPDENGFHSGAAYVFTRSGTTWSPRAYLKASNTGASDWFGMSVAQSGTTAVVGAIFEYGSGTGINPGSNENAPTAGAAYLFDLPRPPLVYSDADDGGDALLYDPGTGNWSQHVSADAGGFVELSAGTWAPGWSVLPATFDGDALTDFFLFNTATGAWAKMINDGGTGFTTQATGGWWPGWERYVLDLDGDGISDFFLYDPATGVWFQCVSTPTGFTYTQGGWNPGWEVYPMRLNADARGDLFLISRATGRWFWVLGGPGGGFTYPVSETWFPGWSLYPGDYNGDGLADILLHDPPTGTYFVAATTGLGFSYQQGGWSLGWTPWVVDLNADGRDDLFLHDSTTGVWFQMLSDGLGNFTNVGGQTWSLGWTLHPTDGNGDGRADLVLYHPASGTWYQARNLVNGSFAYSSGTWSPGLTVVTRAPIR